MSDKGPAISRLGGSRSTGGGGGSWSFSADYSPWTTYTTRYLAQWSWLAMGQYTAKTPCSPHLLTVVSCDGARVQAEARVVGARHLRRGSRGQTDCNSKAWGGRKVAFGQVNLDD